MEIKIPEAIIHAAGIENFKQFEITEDMLTWNRFITLELRRLTMDQTRKVRELVAAHEGIRGAKVVLRDIDTWLEACSKPGGQKVRKVEQFEDLLIEYLLHVPGHRVFKKHDKDGQAWLCYYIKRVQYHEKVVHNYDTTPEHVDMAYAYEEFGKMEDGLVTFWESDVRGMKVEEILARKGYYIETDDIRKKYLAEVKRYRELVPLVGKQFRAVGIALDDIPDARETGHVFNFPENSERNRVVIDIFSEKDKESAREHHVDLETYFWADKLRAYKRRQGDKEDDPTESIDFKKRKDGYETSGTREGLPAEDLEEDPPVIEVPVHPFLVIFDLQRHLRLAIHVNYLTEHVYDLGLADRLILPEELKVLVKMLVEHKQGFKDIIAGKSGGTIILLTGLPGVGKTLTAEVFAESEQKPLYSVQASQLGTDPNQLETELMVVLGRAARWNAVMLLDEADVYVHERGNDLQQNAIVGVFLRVLEYHSSVLFLTTNRPELVDDAIASRCVARIDYPYPTQENQRRIWRVLADSSGISLPQDVIDEFVLSHQNISGRDVKNLLKLARMISQAKAEPITLASLEYVMRFKPTNSPMKKRDD